MAQDTTLLKGSRRWWGSQEKAVEFCYKSSLADLQNLRDFNRMFLLSRVCWKTRKPQLKLHFHICFLLDTNMWQGTHTKRSNYTVANFATLRRMETFCNFQMNLVALCKS